MSFNRLALAAVVAGAALLGSSAAGVAAISHGLPDRPAPSVERFHQHDGPDDHHHERGL